MARKSRSKKRSGFGKFFMTLLILAVISTGIYLYLIKGQEDKVARDISSFVEGTVTTSCDLVGSLFEKKEDPAHKAIPFSLEKKSSKRKIVTVKLYYYNGKKDKQINKNAMGSPDAILPIERTIPATMTPIKDTIILLLEGKLSEADKRSGFSTELPGKHFRLIDAKLRNGILFLHFTDPNRFSSGGSSRVSILSTQIIKTAKQFPGVKEVRIVPETLFQP